MQFCTRIASGHTGILFKAPFLFQYQLTFFCILTNQCLITLPFFLFTQYGNPNLYESTCFYKDYGKDYNVMRIGFRSNVKPFLFKYIVDMPKSI